VGGPDEHRAGKSAVPPCGNLRFNRGVLALAAIGAVALVGAIVATVTWHRGVDERQSVKEYHSTLETLRHVSDRADTSRPRPAARTGRSTGAKSQAPAPARQRASGAAAPGAAAPARTRQRPLRTTVADEPAAGTPVGNGSANGAGNGAGNGHGGDRPALVFDDAAPAPRTVSADPGARRAIERMGGGRAGGRHGPISRTVLTTAAAVAVVGLLTAVAIALVPSHSSSSSSAGPHAAQRTTPHATSRTTSPAPVTAPAQSQPTASTASSATYAAPQGAFTVVLDATGLCWVMAVEASTGKVMWTGTMTAGQSVPIPSAGALKVTLGAASDVTMVLQGKAVALPAGYQSPFVATFTPG
jgi:hypothetical protein